MSAKSMLQTRAGGRAPRTLLQLVYASALALLLGAATVGASVPRTTHFAINAPQLGAALIQFSRQSGLPIVFSSRLTRNMAAPPISGVMGTEDALQLLLTDTGLSWKLIDSRIVAIFETRCHDSGGEDVSCPNPEQTSHCLLHTLCFPILLYF